MNAIVTPVSTELLREGLPHRPPFVWIDEVLSYGPDGGEARVVLKDGAAYMDENGLRPSAIIEFIAQAYGFIAVCENAAQGKTVAVKRAFLAAVKDATLATESLGAEAELRIAVDQIRAMGPITMLQGRVFHGERLVGQAHLRLFSEIDGAAGTP